MLTEGVGDVVRVTAPLALEGLAVGTPLVLLDRVAHPAPVPRALPQLQRDEQLALTGSGAEARRDSGHSSSHSATLALQCPRPHWDPDAAAQSVGVRANRAPQDVHLGHKPGRRVAGLAGRIDA